LIPPEVRAGALSDAASKSPFIENAQLAGAELVMQIVERGEIPVTRAPNKHPEFLEKNTVIREIPKRQRARYCCFAEVAGVKLT
jgi:hypothetical protein